MHPEPTSGGAGAPEPPPRTPNTDLQPEDAGTPESGAQEDGARGNAADKALKQTDKTDPEAGGPR